MGREWALREAHLEIARREKAGLPLISPDLLPRYVILLLENKAISTNGLLFLTNRNKNISSRDFSRFSSIPSI